MRLAQLALALGLAALLVRCGSFSSSTTPPAPSSDASAQDAFAADAPPPPQDDGGPRPGKDAASSGRTVKCGIGACDVGAGEACCVYREVSSTSRRAVCTSGPTCPPPQPGESPEVTVACDDEGDCARGLVCCHAFKSCGVVALDSATCVARENCALCGADASVSTGRIACDPKVKAQCNGGSCVATTSLVAEGYCE
ncbi:MAG: hypothetical protein KC657_26365 [Myxococcales bacterium]|nr:hypothetical protein [Myxococcales bacterium]